MKKIYKEPKIKVVNVRHHQMLCSSPYTDPDVEQIDITGGEGEALPPIDNDMCFTEKWAVSH